MGRGGGTTNFLASIPQTAEQLSGRQAANSATQALLTCASQGPNELEGRHRRIRWRHDPSAPRTHKKPCKHTHTHTQPYAMAKVTHGAN